MNSYNLFIALLIILIIIFIWNKSEENFDQNLSQQYENVDYNTRLQNCNQLTYSNNKCNIETVIPNNINVCNDNLIPTDNIPSKKKNKTFKNKINNDLLVNLNNSEKNNFKYDEKDLITEIKSLNSLENDLISNYN